MELILGTGRKFSVRSQAYVAVLMDDSTSMKLPDEATPTRLDSLNQLMSANSAFHTEIADKFNLRPYKFAATAERVQNAAELSGSGEETNLTSEIDQAQKLP